MQVQQKGPEYTVSLTGMVAWVKAGKVWREEKSQESRLILKWGVFTGSGSEVMRGKSGDQGLDRFTVHISQPETSAVVVVGQLLVINAELMQDRGVYVMN